MAVDPDQYSISLLDVSVCVGGGGGVRIQDQGGKNACKLLIIAILLKFKLLKNIFI